MIKQCSVALAMLIFLIGANSSFATKNNKSSTQLPANNLFQVSVINALAQGVYDSEYTYRSLMAMTTPKTIGVGTFQHLDGEMLALDGQYFQIKSDGHLNVVKPEQRTPFAEIANMEIASHQSIQSIEDYAHLSQLLLNNIKNRNIPYAIRIDASVQFVKLRAVKAQTKPYPKILQAAKDQFVFQLQHVKGSLVGFWFPAYWQGIAVSGFHLHFITPYRRQLRHCVR